MVKFTPWPHILLARIGQHFVRTSVKMYLTFSLLFLIFSSVSAQTIIVDGNPGDWPAVLNNASYVTSFKVDANSVNDNSFTTGSQDGDPISAWGWVLGNTNNKGDITNAGAALIGSNLYFFGDRTSANGSSDIGFWFFKSEVSLNVNGTFSGVHTDGDILVLSTFTNGGSVPNIEVYRWNGSTSKLQQIGGSLSNNAAVNGIQYNVPTYPDWSYSSVDNGTTPQTYPAYLFFEGFINLATLGIDPCFSNFLLETRNSHSLNASLQDFVTGQFATTPLAAVNDKTICAGSSATFTATVVGGLLPLQYSWDGGASWSAPTNDRTSTFDVNNAVANQSVSVLVRGSNSCVSTPATGNLNVNQKPGTPTVSVVDNCNGTSTLTVSNFTGTLKWADVNNGDNPRTVSSAGTYSVTQSVNDCISDPGSGVAAPKNKPGTPTVTVVDNCDGTSTLTVSDFNGTLKWADINNGDNPRTVSSAGTYSVTQSVNDCISDPGSGIAAPKNKPGTPTVTVVDNCDGTSTLTVGNFTGTLKWADVNNGDNPRTVSSAGTYSVTQSVNDCISDPGSGIAAPKNKPGTPTVSVVDNCNGTSTLTVSNFTGTLKWADVNNGDNPRTVSSAGTYSVTQSVNDCISDPGSGIAAPKNKPGTPTVTVVDNCNGTSTLTVSNFTGTITWGDDANNHSNPRTVSSAGTYSVTQSVSDCISDPGSGIAAPKNKPGTPTVSVVDNCDGTSTLTVSNYTGTLNWTDVNNGLNPRTVSSAGTYSVTQSVNDCISDPGSGTAAPKVYGEYCTYTQGYYGNKNGNSCDGTNTFNSPAALINSLLGTTGITVGFGANTITIPAGMESAILLNSMMPGGGTATILPAGSCVITNTACFKFPEYLTKQGKINNVLLSQTITLSLNIRMGNLAGFQIQNGWLTTQRKAKCGEGSEVISCSTDGSAITSIKMNESVVNYLIAQNAATVQGLLNLANAALAGQSGLPKLSDITAAVDAINRGFDQCASFIGYFPAQQFCLSAMVSATQELREELLAQKIDKLSVIAYPNPVVDKVRFELQSPVEGKASLELFNMLGQKVETVFNGHLDAGVKQVVDYKVPQSAKGNLIYILRIGDKKEIGRLIH